MRYFYKIEKVIKDERKKMRCFYETEKCKLLILTNSNNKMLYYFIPFYTTSFHHFYQPKPF